MVMPSPDVGGWTGIILSAVIAVTLAATKLRKLLASDKADVAAEGGRYDIVNGLREQLKYERQSHAQALQYEQDRNSKLATALEASQAQNETLSKSLREAHDQIGALREQVEHLSEQVSSLQTQIRQVTGVAP